VAIFAFARLETVSRTNLRSDKPVLCAYAQFCAIACLKRAIDCVGFGCPFCEDLMPILRQVLHVATFHALESDESGQIDDLRFSR